VGSINKLNKDLLPHSPKPTHSTGDQKAESLSLIWPQPTTLQRFNPPLRLGVMASGNGSNFEALVKAAKRSELDAHICALVVNNPNCEARRRAERLGVKCVVHDHRDFDSREKLDQALVKTFSMLAVEGVVMAGWMRIVTSILIDAYPNRLLNIHPSLLPSFRGLDAVDQAIKARVPLTGCSVHLVEPEVDAGQVLAQAAVPILSSDNHLTLSKRIQHQEHQLLPIAVAIAGECWRSV
jgi:phosphoribosylglycinamide formyltransferase-1